MGRLEIRVCGARNIGNVQKVGKPDPYVKVKMGDDKKTRIKYKTRVIENSYNPVWNELFKFQVADYDSTQILFEMMNDNIMVDDLLGSYRLSLNGLTRGVVEDMWVILAGAKLSSAELHLRVLAADFGREPPAGAAVVSSIEQDILATPGDQKYRPPKNYTSGQSFYPQAPQGLPQTVTYTAPYAGQPAVQAGASAYPPPQAQPIFYPQQSVQQQPQPPVQPSPYYAPPPAQSPYGAYYPQAAPQPPAPVYYPQQPPQGYYPPPPGPVYGQPQPQPTQIAFGVPPQM